MKLMRTIPWFTRLLVGLFLAAQFAGMVSSRANALPLPAAGAFHHMDARVMDVSQGHHRDDHHHAQGHGDHPMPCGHPDHSGPADACCSLHACFTGLMPPAIAVATDTIAGELLSAGADDLAPGAPGGRLDRPPRPQH